MPDGQPSWTVLPVKLVDTWMPKSVFDHKPHAEQSCESCHQAERSAAATDVLMPNIESCQTCHGGEHSENKLNSECIDCHRFHNPNQSLMGQGDLSAYHTGFIGVDP
jgi:predicted CXXCH cytochrome family protein